MGEPRQPPPGSTSTSTSGPASSSGSSPASAATPAPAWRKRVRELFWIAIWLVFLVEPASSLPGMDPVAPAAAGLAAFVLAYLTLLWSCWHRPPDRRPSPAALAGLAVLTALGVALAAGYGDQGGWALVLVYVGAAGVATLPEPRLTRGWLAGTIAVQLAIGAGHGAPLDELVTLAVITLLVGVLSLVFRGNLALIARLRRTRAELAETAVTAERLRFARDLHDLLGHTLSLIVVKAEVVKRSADRDPAAAAREAGDIEQIGRQALAEVREAVTGYRERPFAAELDAARSALADAGLQVTVRTTGTPLPAPADSLFGWVVREATTNVVRHSGAEHCEIEVRRVDGRATLEVRDDGRGGAGPDGEPVTAGRGLAGLAERLAEAGGRLEAGDRLAADRSGPRGWRVTATVPVTPPGAP